MYKKIKKMSDYELGELGKKYNEQVQKDAVSSLKKGIEQSKLLKYGMNTYAIPQKIQKEPISTKFIELWEKGKFNSEKDVDDYFKKNDFI